MTDDRASEHQADPKASRTGSGASWVPRAPIRPMKVPVANAKATSRQTLNPLSAGEAPTNTRVTLRNQGAD